MTLNQLLTEPTQFFSHASGELIAALVFVSVILSFTLLLSFKKIRNLARQLARVQNDLKVSRQSVINIGQQLLSLEKKLSQLSVPQATESPRPTIAAKSQVVDSEAKPQAVPSYEEHQVDDNNESIYDKARYYLAKGDSVESIAKRCNLSHAEVSLLEALNKKAANSLS